MSRLRLFVYGSLKRAGRHHDQLKSAEVLGEVETAPGYALEPVGEYLALIALPGAGSVAGELFEISESLLPVLDDFEGDAYIRGEVRLKGEPHETALAYFKKAR